MKQVKYDGTLAKVQIAGISFLKGEITPVSDTLAAKLLGDGAARLGNPDFSLVSEMPTTLPAEVLTTGPENARSQEILITDEVETTTSN